MGKRKYTIEILSNVRARLDEDLPEKAIKKVDTALSYDSPRMKYMPWYIKKKLAERKKKGLPVWDGKVRFLAQPSMTFPLGFLDTVRSLLSKYKLRIKDKRRAVPKPVGIDGIKIHGKLKPYEHQVRAVATCIEAERGIVKVGTGGGKTFITAMLAQAFGSKKGKPAKTVVLLHKRQLARQTQKDLAGFLGQPVGLIGMGKWHEEQVTVVILDTFSAKKYAKLRRVLNKSTDLLVVDEAHHGAAKKWGTPIRNIDAPFRIALSATPLDRSDGKNMALIGLTGELLVDVPAKELWEKGIIAKPTVRFREIKLPNLDGVYYDEAYEEGVVNNEFFHKRVRKDVRKAVKKKDRVLVIVRRIAHGQALYETFSEKGIDCRFIHYKTPDEEIDEAVRDFEHDEFPVLIASPIFGEGINIPAVDTLVNASGGKSVIDTLQKAGRAMRKKKGKANVCEIIDYIHYTNKHLLKHSLNRFETYQREHFKTRLI